MKRYIDGFVFPIPKDRVADYQAIAEAACVIWKDCGALEYSECVADDLNTDPACGRPFVDMTQATDSETIIFAWAAFESRAARDAANQKIMSDPRMQQLMATMAKPQNRIVDNLRMSHGGFREIVRG